MPTLPRRALPALLALPLAAPARAEDAWLAALARQGRLAAGTGALIFPMPSRRTVPGQHAEGTGHAEGRPLGRFAIAAPPLTLPDAPFAVLLPEPAQLRRLLAAGLCEAAPPAHAVTLDGWAVPLAGAWLLRLRDGASPAGDAA